jgi:hypothetical protein
MKRTKKKSTKPQINKDDVQLLRHIFQLMAWGGYDAREAYCSLRALAELIHRIDPKGVRIWKDPDVEDKK